MSETFDRVLTDHQGAIADAVIAVLTGFEVSDAFPAICSVLAATINTHAPNRSEAIAVATLFGDELLELVEMGQSGLLRTPT